MDFVRCCPNTVEILANSVLSNCDVLLLPNNQLTDDEQMYSFLLDEMENLRWLFNNITTEYVCNVKEVCYNMIEKVENNRSMLIPIIHSFSYLAFFAYEEAVTAVFTKEEAIELLQKYDCIISFVKYIHDYDEELFVHEMWHSDLMRILADNSGR